MSELAHITRVEGRGMITFRGDLKNPATNAAVKAVTGHDIPKPGQISGNGEGGVLWMSPDELLLLVGYERVNDTLDAITTALVGEFHLTADVSDARAVFRIEGSNAAHVLARLSPVDVHPDVFGIGNMRRSRLAQVAAAFWRDETGFDLVCFRSVGDYVETLLATAAASNPSSAL